MLPHLQILDSRFSEILFDKVFPFILFSSPLIGLALNTLKALGSGLLETSLLQDPAHIRIRIYDTLIALTSLAVGTYIVLLANDLNLSALSEGRVLFVVLFPQLSDWASFFILYGISALLYFYDVKRGDIIRTINEKHGAW